MSEVILSIPDESVQALRLPPDAVGSELRMAAAVKLYELGRLSSGAAAQLAGVSKPLFMSRLAIYGVDALQLSVEELDGETPLA